MNAVVMHERGGPEVLRYESFPTPSPGRGEVLLRVHAATVNHTDIFHRTGRFFIQKPLPHVLGMDVAGEIVAVGEDVTGWEVGDRCAATFEALGRERDGAYAEFTTLPARELRRIPDELDYVAAATIGLAFTTAWLALFHAGHLGDGERIVIHAASSGVGTSAIQIAKWKRAAPVIAISERAKAARLRELGADVVIDRNAPDLVQEVMAVTGQQGATIVLELVGRPTLQASLGMLAPDGRIVCAGTLGGDLAEINVMELIMKRGRIAGSFGTIPERDYDEIFRLYATGTFRPVIDSVMPLRDAKAAHERIEAKLAFGKVVLVP
jgi:NADPH:quinone reductase-like Zn-dependent oxidoreductase